MMIIEKVSYKLVYSFFFIMSVFGLIAMFVGRGEGDYNLLPVNPIFESFFVLLVLVSFSYKFKVSELITPVGVLIFLSLTFFIFYLRNDKNYAVTDYILIYKAYYYLLLLSLPLLSTLTKTHFVKVFNFLTTVFFVKYTATIFLFGADRPGLFIENNFELLMLVMLYFTLAFHKVDIPKLVIVVLFLTIFISGSRSAFACLAFCILVLRENKSILKIIINVLVAILAVVAMSYILYSRLGDSSIDTIDRVKFLYVFLDEVSQFNFYEYLFGADIITPLSDNSCLALSYYSSLFSNNNSNTCFSVVLHSFDLRFLFDHGILGLLILLMLFYRILVARGYKPKFSIYVICIALLNGVSVSSLNNIFFAIAFLIIMLASDSIIKHHNLVIKEPRDAL